MKTLLISLLLLANAAIASDLSGINSRAKEQIKLVDEAIAAKNAAETKRAETAGALSEANRENDKLEAQIDAKEKQVEALQARDAWWAKAYTALWKEMAYWKAKDHARSMRIHAVAGGIAGVVALVAGALAVISVYRVGGISLQLAGFLGAVSPWAAGAAVALGVFLATAGAIEMAFRAGLDVKVPEPPANLAK